METNLFVCQCAGGGGGGEHSRWTKAQNCNLGENTLRASEEDTIGGLESTETSYPNSISG